MLCLAEKSSEDQVQLQVVKNEGAVSICTPSKLHQTKYSKHKGIQGQTCNKYFHQCCSTVDQSLVSVNVKVELIGCIMNFKDNIIESIFNLVFKITGW